MQTQQGALCVCAAAVVSTSCVPRWACTRHQLTTPFQPVTARLLAVCCCIVVGCCPMRQAGENSGTTLLVKDMVGVGTVLYPGLIWLLLDGDDRGRLGASTFRALNGVCGLVCWSAWCACMVRPTASAQT